MLTNWISVTIGDFCDAGLAEIQTGPFGSQLHAHEYTSSGVPVVPTSAIGRRLLLEESLSSISTEKAAELGRHRLLPGDILFARRGAQATGLSAIVREHQVGWICGTGAIRLRLNADAVDPVFLSFYLSSDRSYEWLRQHAVGATMPNLNEDVIRRVPLHLPPLPEQRGIAAVLGALDDKIALSHRMNRTLEEMAQAIFKSWFVDFDGQTEFEDSGTELGEVPRGWDVGRISDLAHLNPSAWTRKNAPEFIHYLALTDTSCGNYGEPLRLLFSDAPSRARRMLADGDTIFGQVRPANGSYALIQDAEPNLTGSTGFAVLRPIQTAARYFVYLWVTQRATIDYLASVAHGSACPAVAPEIIHSLSVPIPPAEKLVSFDSVVHPLFARRAVNRKQSRTLAELRDTLLPRLISGEIRVPEAEAAVGDAT
jgi:type I restriction enzyme S subunit